jgi:hypothetical protein
VPPPDVDSVGEHLRNPAVPLTFVGICFLLTASALVSGQSYSSGGIHVWTGHTSYTVGDDVTVYWDTTFPCVQSSSAAAGPNRLVLIGPNAGSAGLREILLDPNVVRAGVLDVGPTTQQDIGSWNATLVVYGPNCANSGYAYYQVVPGGQQQASTTTQYTSSLSYASDFSLSFDPDTVSLPPGGSVTTNIITQSMGGFSSPIDFQFLYGQPAASTWWSLSPPVPVTPPANLRVTTILTFHANMSTPAGAYKLTLVGTSGALTHTAVLAILIVPAFSITTTAFATSSNTQAFVTSVNEVAAAGQTPFASGMSVPLGIVLGLLVSLPVSLYRFRKATGSR